jgi:hypothetical protein
MPVDLFIKRINANSHIISGGEGGDFYFELETSTKTGCAISLFALSPTGVATISNLSPLVDGIQFYPFAFAAKPGVEAFAMPLDLSEGSYREPLPGQDPAGEWPAVSVQDFMKQKDWKFLDLLRLHIKGFEFSMLDSLLRDKVSCRQLLVEFQYGKRESHSFWNYFITLVRLQLAGYRLVHLYSIDHTFVLL